MELSEIHLVLASDDPATAMQEAGEVVRIQHGMGWIKEAVPTHTLRTGALFAATGLVDLGYVLLAKNSKDKVVGFARVTTTGKSNEHFLHELGVAPDWQLKGLGKLLMDGVGEASLQKGATALLFTFNGLNARNAYFYFHKCRVEGLRLLRNFYGVSSEGNSYSVLSRMVLEPVAEASQVGAEQVEVVAQAAQFSGQSHFKVPVSPEIHSYIPFNHPLTLLNDSLLMDLLAKGAYRVTDYHRSNNHFWVFTRTEEILG